MKFGEFYIQFLLLNFSESTFVRDKNKFRTGEFDNLQ